MRTEVLATVALLLLGAAHAGAQDTRPNHAYAALPAPGSRVPTFMFDLTDGGSVSNESLRGRPAVLAFWATWCHASRAVLRDIEALHSDYHPRGASVIIVANNTADELRSFFVADSAHPPLAVAGEPAEAIFDRSRSAPERLRVRVQWALPLFLVIDSDGRIVSRDGGPRAFAGLRAKLDSLLTSPRL